MREGGDFATRHDVVGKVRHLQRVMDQEIASLVVAADLNQGRGVDKLKEPVAIEAMEDLLR
jgi:hypothetical protein